MEIRRCADVPAFLAEAGAFLTDREAEHNLILGICSRLAARPDPTAPDPLLRIALEGDRIVGVALETPPMNLILSEIDDPAAVSAFASDLHSQGARLPGVLGPIAAARAFAHGWIAMTGGSARLAMRERIYRAREARPPREVAGTMRDVTPEDGELLLRWLEAFVAETFPDDVAMEPAENILRRRKEDRAGGHRLWEVDGAPVSLAGFGGSTPNGIRIGPVYTPPEHRRQGFAEALVGTMTQMLLDRGHRFCFLFTDLANPTSNGVYQRVGYEPVSDVDQYTFG